MNLRLSREALVRPLQFVAGVVERRNTMPILANVLLEVDGETLKLTGTDLEVELVARVALDESFEPWKVTLPARKLLDLCKSLPAESQLAFAGDSERVTLKSGRSRYALAALSADDFPDVEIGPEARSVEVSQADLGKVIEATSFAMAVQDVRYYLNGMLLELRDGAVRTVATDGHRLALAGCSAAVSGSERQQVILPRKGVLELQRVLGNVEGSIRLQLTQNHLRADIGEFTFTTKLVDGKFPDYERVIPRGGDKEIVADKESFKAVLTRASILSNEKYRGIRLTLTEGNLQIVANNPEQEEAEENLSVDYQGESLEVGFNVAYLIDVLNAIRGEQVMMVASDANSSALVRDFDDESALYVVMPMRL